ncbi:MULTISPECIES: patatin-like phospholipase family protein [Zoogloea]|uniref:Patatin-like phospholipase family protein n=1 Tax=Zoogloea oleivorans TaxID=1552750 RepID=A0A6C2CQY0_9RHOO|nr:MULTISPECIES: patatin-like phospholipase family protein [Zoogloea]MBP8133680.1 patatin-like phospholipase family protein [Zoogloea sp.]MDD2667182.1 patatin-like phospholipase family protein [Zoogloea sp.]MDY0035752.1 patatin-like phospholipase family protein [Zoogloea oleivorans]TYC55899.1 patatin-like phospholipase family protein [Zoogloea oleivorans]
MNTRRRLLLGGASALGLAACGELPRKPDLPAPRPAAARLKPRIALALGGGAARGFAHIGVIKALETNGIVPDFVVGTSAGSVVGALYAAGHGPFELQKLAIQLDESSVTDWSLFDRGVIKGEALERFINTNVGNRPIEGLKRRFAAVATDLQSGEPIIFQRGNTGTAVRASSSIPGVFPPVAIGGREYVDGGLVAPIPVKEARSLGADIVIAVDISGRPSGKKNQGSLDVLLDTIAIMGGALGKVELHGAEVVISPDMRGLASTNFQQRHEAILAGEKVGFAAIARVKDAIAAWERKNG